MYGLSVLFVFALLALYASAAGESCTSEQATENPCRCCKMGCWYAIAKSATHELGHVPGQAGEDEALATLKLIRVCMMEECAGICVAKTPFRPGMLALAEARKRLQL